MVKVPQALKITFICLCVCILVKDPHVALTWISQVHIVSCQRHLFKRRRGADKVRLLQHRKERLSYDPRMPARLASFPSHMPCQTTPPYALLDSAAPTATTALNLKGDGWSPIVDVVRLECPSPSSSPGDCLPLTVTLLELKHQDTSLDCSHCFCRSARHLAAFCHRSCKQCTSVTS